MKRLTRVVFLLIFILGWPSFCYARDDSINWTPEELAFMEAHPVIRLGVDPKFVPFEFLDEDGTYQGLTSDYLEIISEKTGLELQVTEGLTWTEAYEKALQGEIDMLPAVSKTPAREQNFLFSEPYYYFKRVIVVRDSTQGINSIEDLYGQTVAVQRNSSHQGYLEQYPQINLSLYDSAEATITAVANGTETVCVGNLATSNYIIQSTGLTNLKYVAFEAENQQGLYFAVRKDWPELIDIMNKALAMITKEERIAINSKWIGVDVEPNYEPVYQVVMVVSGVIILIWLVSIYWILRLRREIDTRKKIQCDLEIARQEAEAANNIKSSFLARMSHEIRTPLNAITGMAYLVKKTQVTMTQKMYLERITQSANTMLSIINDILDFSKMDGKIQVYSTAGEGSTFIVELSLEIDPQKEAEYQQQVSSLYFNDIKTLVLEKTGSNMNVIDSYLGAFGMHCELTTSPTSAINMLELENGKFSEPFDLLILDYDTPAGGGFKFIEMIQDNKRMMKRIIKAPVKKKILKKPRVIMLLPMMREDLFDQLDSQGVDIGIGKPIIPSVLYNGILEIFRTKAIVANQEFKQEAINKDIMAHHYGILVVEDNKTNQLIANLLRR